MAWCRHGADWLPTLASVAGYDVGTIPLPLDGVDQWAAINGGGGGDDDGGGDDGG